MGFEPTPPKRIELKSTALDPSAIQAYLIVKYFGRDRDRTCDRWLIRPLLYRLSYTTYGLLVYRSWVRLPLDRLIMLHWRSWQRIGLMYRRSRVRAPDGAFGLFFFNRFIVKNLKICT